MVESGGPTTQAGIYYQNTIASLYLGRMLDLRQRPISDKVIQVKVEALEHVDDIVVTFGDGRKKFIQAKRTLDRRGKPWKQLWSDIEKQIESNFTYFLDRISIVLGQYTSLSHDLKECCLKASSCSNDSEFDNRLTQTQKKVVASILKHVRETQKDSSTVSMLSRIDVEVVPEESVEKDFAPNWLPQTDGSFNTFLSVVRDLVGGESRFRGTFNASSLRARLRDEHGICIEEPTDWGASKYREIVQRSSEVSIPGTAISHHVDQVFVWSKAMRIDRTKPQNFDDEAPRYPRGTRADDVDLSRFPFTGETELVVVAGPGFGKSTLTLALSTKIAQKGLLPVTIPITELTKLDLDIYDYLSQQINKRHGVNIDWDTAASAGLVVLLLDGLDEVSSVHRTVILERVKTYIHSHPTTPWLLTVRDISALSIPTKAKFVSLSPLNDAEILSFVDNYRPDNPEFSAALNRTIWNNEELHRLLRIPLFLTIALATTETIEHLPSKRTTLIENYLQLLFHPEQFKCVETSNIDFSILRPISETVAFEALERDEIGVQGRVIENIIRGNIPEGCQVYPVLEQLVKIGVLRKGTPGQYLFPFPIIQEYLAACHILSNRVDEIGARFEKINKKPWAQTVQFVLEQHISPSTLISDLLEREDDAFASNLRLIARCVANGAKVSRELRTDIARRLSEIWPSASWQSQDQVGQLIHDAFCIPLIPEIERQLLNKWSIDRGGGAIVTKIGDKVLTQKVLKSILKKNLKQLYNLGDLQSAVDLLGDEALKIYISVFRESEQTEEDYNAITCLIGHLSPKYVSDSTCSEILNDERLPIGIRLATSRLSSSSESIEFQKCAENVAISDGFQPGNIAIDVISEQENPTETVLRILKRTDVETKEKLQFISHIAEGIYKLKKTGIFEEWQVDPHLDNKLRLRLQIYRARFGDQSAMEALISDLVTLDHEDICAVISLLGHFRSRTIVQLAVDQLRSIDFSPSDLLNLVNAINIGMNYIFEMFLFQSGSLIPSSHHPGIDLFQNFLEEKILSEDLSPIQALRFDDHLANLGSESATDRLLRRIEEIIETDNIDFNDSENSYILGNAIDTLLERNIKLPIPLLESIVKKGEYNEATSAIDMIAAYADRTAIDVVIHIHNNEVEDWHLRDAIGDTVEKLAGRLGMTIVKKDNNFVVSM